MLLAPSTHARRSLIARGGGWPSTLRGPPKEGALTGTDFWRSLRYGLGTVVRFEIAASGGTVDRSRSRAGFGSESRHGDRAICVRERRFAPSRGRTEAACSRKC